VGFQQQEHRRCPPGPDDRKGQEGVLALWRFLSERELAARVEIIWERYVKVSNIEANCALDMAKTMILPAAVKYLGELAAAGSSKGGRNGGR